VKELDVIVRGGTVVTPAGVGRANVGEGKLDEQSLVGTVVAEVATRSRQAGVPCHAIVGTRKLDAMGARVLDLERVLEATTLHELRDAGRRLAELL